jgi:type VI secretion system protein ImpL
VVITKCDKIPFYSDFFRRLPESEVNQVLGCTLPPNSSQAARASEVFVEAEAKRLTASFRPLYHALARRRLTHLAHEPNSAQRPGVYEFPREFKRIRSPLVKLLTDVFRPNALGPSPVLRGYYFTGVRETEVEVHAPAGRGMDTLTQAPMEATGLFRGDATQMFQGDDFTKAPSPGSRRAIGLRWMFATDLFHRVILPDRLPRKVRPPEGRADRYRKLAFGAVYGLCALLCLAFFVSWVNNRRLLSDLEGVAGRQANRQGRATSLQDLRALDALREQVVRLQSRLTWGFHWGLYSGDRVLDQARTAYFRQFQRLLLIDLNSQMVGDLEGLPATPDATAPFDPAYNTLKAHLMITSGSCPVDSPFVSRQLKDVRARIASGAETEWQGLADRQIDFYARELARGNPLRLPEDSEGRDRARQYLVQIKGIDRLYATILASAEKSLGKLSLGAWASNYAEVLNGPSEVRSAFSPAGWAYLEKASKEGNTAVGEPCVLGGGVSGMVTTWKQNTEATQAIQRKFLREYVEQWRKFVEGFSVTKYASAGDAARKLEILSDRKSPLLAVFVMTAGNTNFPAPAGQADATLVQKSINKLGLGEALKKGETQAKAVVSTPPEATDSLNSPADIPRYFQPVHAVEPPGSVTGVVDKNAAYIDALVLLRGSMQDIAQRGSDPAVHQMAAQNYDKALGAARQIARGFNAVGVGNLDATVGRLLEEPIRLTDRFIIKDMDKAGAGKVNGELRAFCTSQANTLRKYPFRPSNDDASMEDFAGMFQPLTGAIWRFQQQSLAELTVKEGSLWKPKDPAKKPQITQAMLDFLNRAQAVTDVFYPAGATQPHFTYTLRPNLDKSLKEFNLELEIDGQPYQLTVLRHDFSWPPPPGAKNVGAVARLRSTVSNVAFAFASRGGIWGIFRILGDAEPRDLNAKAVEWKNTSGGVGRPEPITPAPVQAEIVGFPGGQDVFNPKFWNGLRCPSVAVQ